MFIFRVLNTVPYTNEAGAKDLIASLHSFVTSNFLVGLAVLVSWKQFGGKPIECMVPTDFTNAWVQYAENYCWSQDTYFLPFSATVADSPKDEKVSYYQWMPFFLLFEAACFKLPCFIWKYFASQSGMRVGEILRIASDDHNAVPEVKKSNIESLSTHLQGALRFQKRLKSKRLVPHKVLRFLNVKYSTHYVVFIYFIAKVAFLLNVGLQANLLNDYLLPRTREHKSFGFDMWRILISGNQTWMESGLFPRVTMCDFQVREMGNMQTYTVQCVLLLNVFTEKIFAILWAWYIILAALTACNLFSWVFIVFSKISREHFIFSHLEMCEAPFNRKDAENQANVDRFLDLYLGLDGIFLLQLIAQHADVVFTTELIGSLWEKHHSIEAQRGALKQMDIDISKLRMDEKVEAVNSSTTNTPDGPRIRNPRHSVKPDGSSGSTPLKRTASFDNGEVGKKQRFDEDSEEDDKKTISNRSSTKKNRKQSKT